jgi:mono/diheme cytochrome c family protein
MRRGAALGLALGTLALGGVLGFFLLSAPQTWRMARGATIVADKRAADIANGARIFDAGGCASCHATPGQDDRVRLGGGLAFHTPFGTMNAPNISPDTTLGIGNWSLGDFARAMREGVSPQGRHYYPAFPYTSYQRMTPDDVADLFGYIKSLPKVADASKPHQMNFPFNITRGLGLWKLAFLDGKPFTPDPARDAQWNLGAYLVNGPGHCAECHSPRNAAGAIIPWQRFAGGPDPEGRGFVPNITQAPNALAKWSASDIAELLKTGFTPDYDSVGGSMAPVIKNTSRLSDADRAAMAAYIKSLPPIETPPRPKKTQ